VPGTASVLELKKAIEEKFGDSQMEEGKISWCHVWGNFCLAYDDQELINDGSLLSSFGIKDSDESFLLYGICLQQVNGINFIEESTAHLEYSKRSLLIVQT